MTPREIQHAAAVRMVRFDRQPAAVRAIIAAASVNVRVPNRVLTVKQAATLAKGARRA